MARASAEDAAQDVIDTVWMLREAAETQIRILDLAKIIETRELANRDKDRAVLPLSRKTLELKQQES